MRDAKAGLMDMKSCNEELTRKINIMKSEVTETRREIVHLEETVEV